jgi:hypothetical protein
VLPLLERFEKIYLWMDNDRAGLEGIEKFTQKLGPGRTYIVRPLPEVRSISRLAAEVAYMQPVENPRVFLPLWIAPVITQCCNQT